jgi:hypothetical protein
MSSHDVIAGDRHVLAMVGCRPRSGDAPPHEPAIHIGAPPLAEPPLSYEGWEQSVPSAIREDPLWSLRIYRLALYAGELGRRDGAYLATRTGYASIAEQLVGTTGAIGANIARGYSCAGRERLRHYECALGAAREARDAYFRVRSALGPGGGDSRLSLLATIIKILAALLTKARLRTAVRV